MFAMPARPMWCTHCGVAAKRPARTWKYIMDTGTWLAWCATCTVWGAK